MTQSSQSARPVYICSSLPRAVVQFGVGLGGDLWQLVDTSHTTRNSSSPLWILASKDMGTSKIKKCSVKKSSPYAVGPPPPGGSVTV